MNSLNFENLAKLQNRIAKWACKRIERLRPSAREKLHKIIDNIFITRRRLEKRLQRRIHENNSRPLFEVERSEGFSRLEIRPSITPSAIEFAREILREFKNSKSAKLNSKDYLQQIWNLSHLQEQSMFLLDWALEPGTLKAVENYFKKVPILHDISVFYSPEKETEKVFQGSQLFHMDGGGTQSIKIWLLCEAVEAENGPTVLIPSAISAKLAARINYRPGDRVPDDSSLAEGLQEAVSLIGPAGQWFVTDTDRCFHYGSRTQKSSSRLVIMFHYVDNNSTYYMPLVSKHYSSKFAKVSDAVREKIKDNVLAQFVLQSRL